jgi:hypothetical protein
MIRLPYSTLATFSVKLSNLYSCNKKNHTQMNRANQNLLINFLLLALFISLISTGVLLHYILPPGTGRWVTIWGMDRHQWGGIHFWIAVVFMLLILIHLYQHWRCIVIMIRGKNGKESHIVARSGIPGLVIITVLAMAPLLSPQISSEQVKNADAASRYDDIIIRGSMTLDEIEAQTGVPGVYILETLDLPANTAGSRRLGNLARTHNLEMNDFREAVISYLSER